MAETRPRDLTLEERALLDTPVAGAAAQSAPLRIPPGTSVAIESLDPRLPSARADGRTEMAGEAPAASPGAEPPPGDVPAAGDKAQRRRKS